MSGSDWKDEIDEIHRRQQFAAEMGGHERVERQRSRGKLTVREMLYFTAYHAEHHRRLIETSHPSDH